MQKLYRNYIVINLTVISFSLLGMEKSNQMPQQPQKPHYTVTIQPLGGYIRLNEYTKIMYIHDYNMKIKNTVNKVIHFTPINCKNENDTHTQNTDTLLNNLKYNKPVPVVPLNLFTEDQSYNITQDSCTITLVSDSAYEEDSFISYNK